MSRLASFMAVVTLFLCVVAVPCARAGTKKKEKEKTIRVAPSLRVIVSGQTTLEPEVVVQMTGLRSIPTLTEEEIRKRLETTGLFSYINVSRFGHTIYIRVRQKVTLFAFPYISVDSTGTYYSGTIGKQIVFGEDALAVAHYQVGPGDHEGTFFVRDGATLGTPVILELSFSFEDALHWLYQGRNVVWQYENVYYGGHLELGYQAYPFLSGSIVNYVEDHRYQERSLEPFVSGFQWSTMGKLVFDRLYQEEGLTTGYQIKYSYEETVPISHFKFWRTKISPTWGVWRHDPFNWVVRADASYSPTLPFYQLAELGGDQLRGYDPEQFRDHDYALIQNDLFLTSTDFWKLNLRTFTFLDWGFVNSGGRTGVGGGLQIYPKRIAIAAFKVYVGYGLNPAGFAAAAALGSSFE